MTEPEVRIGEGRSMEDVLSGEGILRRLPAEANFCRDRIRVFDSLASTNRTLKEMAAAGAAHGTLIAADRQSAGRGRLDHSFFSPPGGLYMSLLLRAERLPFEDLSAVTAWTAVAVCGAIGEIIGREPEIKWVNDLLLEGRKVCGILAEAVTDPDSGRIGGIVAGIGINARIREKEFPEEFRARAGSLDPEGLVPEIRNRLAAGILTRMVLQPVPSQAEVMAAYRRRLGMLGREVLVLRPGQAPYPAKALDLDTSGGLIVQRAGGEREVLSSGEIHLQLPGKG